MADSRPCVGRQNLRFNPKQFGHIEFDPLICRAPDGLIDRKEGLLDLSVLA